MTPLQITAALAALGLLLYAASDLFRKWQIWPKAAKKTTGPKTPAAELYATWQEIIATIESNGYDAESLPAAEIPKALAIKK